MKPFLLQADRGSFGWGGTKIQHTVRIPDQRTGPNADARKVIRKCGRSEHRSVLHLGDEGRRRRGESGSGRESDRDVHFVRAGPPLLTVQ